MTSATQIEQGDPLAAEQLLPLVYEELRKLAATKLANEKPGQTLQATALVHEAYIRLVDVEKAQKWDSRGHFFAAAAEAMRRILVENARRKDRLRHGGGAQRRPLCEEDVAVVSAGEELLELDDAISKLAAVDPQSAELVKLRVFAGLTVAEAGEILGIPERTARRNWAYFPDAAPLPIAASTIALNAPYAVPIRKAWARTPIRSALGVCGTVASTTAAPTSNAPLPNNTQNRPTRSQNHPPTTQPTALVTPAKCASNDSDGVWRGSHH